MRETISSANFLIVTPGIRSHSDLSDDQKRTLSAAAAINAGADYLVVGRPILNAADPFAAAVRLAAEIDDALANFAQPS